MSPIALLTDEQWSFQLTRRPIGTGLGVRVGIIDTGACKNHPNLSVHAGRNLILGESVDDWWNDISGHGTHVTGIIKARPTDHCYYRGYAPDADVFVYRVFGGADGDGYGSTINKAIRQAIADQCDIINFSLGFEKPMESTRIKLEAARMSGVCSVAAAGNHGKSVEYPAAFSETLAVTAIVRFGTYPGDSLHCMYETSLLSTDGQLYVPKFSCHGPEIALAAPGVGVVSTVPDDGFAAMDGTSMACPHIAGIAAALLSEDVTTLVSTRDIIRAEAIEQLVMSTAVDVGFPSSVQGAGVPQL